MEIRVEHCANVSILHPAGRLVIGAPEELVNGTVERLVGSGRIYLLVDLSEVTMMDSSGVESVIRSWRLTRERGGNVKLLDPQPRIKSLLDLTRLGDVIEIHTDRAAALAGFPRPAIDAPSSEEETLRA